jgi:hypothetical protein
MTNPGNDGVPQHAGPRPSWVARARKFLVGAAGLLAQVVAAGVFDDANDQTTRLWVAAILAVATAAGIYQVPNAQSPA